MKKKIRIGCDPGAKGGIVAIYEDGSFKMFKTPLVKKEIDINAFKNTFLDLAGNIDNTGNWESDILVIIEDVHSIHGAGAGSNFSFGRALGILEGITLALDLPCIKVAPKTWQNLMFQGIPMMYKPAKVKVNAKGTQVVSKPTDTKAMALLAAKRLYPNVAFKATDRSKVDHDGIVDSLLLAKFGFLRY